MPKTLMVFAVLAMWDCGGSEEAATPPIANVEGEVAVAANPPSVRAAHGGTVVQVGQHPVEVVANSGGEVRAYVRGDAPPPPDRVRMTVRVPDAQGERHPVMLVWNPAQRAYVGRARRVQIAPGAIGVQMAYGGERYEAEAPSYIIVEASSPTVAEVVEVEESPQVVVQQPSRPTIVVERPTPTVVVERPSPTIVVERPSRPTIVVERPRPTIIVERPRPAVVVVQPQRPGVVVIEGGHGKFKHRGRGHGHGHH